MDAFQYWRQPTWAYTINEEPEQNYHGRKIILQELERQREDRLQQAREISMDNMMKSLEKSCEEIKEGLEDISKMMSEVILLYFEEKSIIEEEKEEEVAEIPQSSTEFNQDEPNEPSCSSSIDHDHASP